MNQVGATTPNAIATLKGLSSYSGSTPFTLLELYNAGQALTPLASLTYAYLRQNGYTESGGNGAALSVDASHTTSVQSDLGAKIERAFTSHYGVLIPSVQVAWHHEYDHQKATVAAQFAADPLGQTRFTTEGATPVSDTGVLTAGLTLLRANNLSVMAQYTLQAGSGYVSQSGALKLRQLF